MKHDYYNIIFKLRIASEVFKKTNISSGADSYREMFFYNSHVKLLEEAANTLENNINQEKLIRIKNRLGPWRNSMKSILECIANLETMFDEFDLTDGEKELISDAVEWLSQYEDLKEFTGE